MRVLHNFWGFNINTTAFCLGRNSLHFLLFKSSMDGGTKKSIELWQPPYSLNCLIAISIWTELEAEYLSKSKNASNALFIEETLRQIPYALMLLKEPNPRSLLSLFLPDPYSYNMGGGYNPGYGYSGYGNVSDQRIDFKPELDDSTRSLLERAKNVRQNPVWDEEIRYLLGCNFSLQNLLLIGLH